MKAYSTGKCELNGRVYVSGQEIDPRDASAAIERGWARTRTDGTDGQSPIPTPRSASTTTPVDAIKAIRKAPERK